MRPDVHSLYDPTTGTLTHVVHAGRGSVCAIIDPVLDYDAKSGRTSTVSADALIAAVRSLDLRVEWILETHAHADHISSAPYVKQVLGGRIAIGERIREVQDVFRKVFNLEPEFHADGSQFDHLFADGESFGIGALQAKVMHVPGHTPACVAYLVGDCAFVGDTLFLPDVGTARCDFPGGDAATLFRSVRRLLALSGQTKLYMCHDYPPAGRELRFCATVDEERGGNIHVADGIAEEAFVDMRTRRDATLSMPTLILPSVQLNIRAGKLPPADDNGIHYLKIPLNAL